MVVKLSNISSKTGKNAFFAFLGHFWAYVRQPQNQIGWAPSMPLASINPTYPRTNQWDFHEKMLRIEGVENLSFFESAVLIFFFTSSQWKLIQNYRIARLFRYFHDYFGFQPQTTPAYKYATQCTYLGELQSSSRLLFGVPTPRHPFHSGSIRYFKN